MRKNSIDNFGMSGSTPAFGPMSSTVSGSAIGPALTDLGGPLLGKTAAMQFEVMSKKAQAEILSDPSVPLTAKISLALHHTKLSNSAKVKLAHHILKSVPAHEKRAFMGKMLGMMGKGLKAMKPGFGNSAALQGQLRSMGGVGNVRNNLKAMGQWAVKGVPMSQLAMRGGHGLGHYPTMVAPGMMDDAASAISKAAPSASSIGKSTATMGSSPMAGTAKGSLDDTMSFSGRSGGMKAPAPAYDADSIFPQTVNSGGPDLDAADLTSLGRGSKPSFGSYPNQSNATQLSPSKLISDSSWRNRNDPTSAIDRWNAEKARYGPRGQQSIGGNADQSALTQLSPNTPTNVTRLDDSALAYGQGW